MSNPSLKSSSRIWRAALALAAPIFLPHLAQAAPTVAAPYTATVFATAPAGSTAPDSIAVDGSNVWIAYGNGLAADGSQDNLNSTIVHYSSSGAVIQSFLVPGHNDGLKIDPSTHNIWAVQNEDGSPNLRVINPNTSAVTPYTFGPTPHGGGYDDIVFTGGKVFISASSPASPPSTPVIVQATLGASSVNVSPVLQGDAAATDIATGGPIKLNVTDPDSMTLSSTGDVVLDDQSGNQLAFVHNPGTPGQTVSRLSLSNPAQAPENVDDTVFSPGGMVDLLATERATNTIYRISGPFAGGNAFSADPAGGIVAGLNLTTGTLTPIFTDTGSSVRGLDFVSVPEPSMAALITIGGSLLVLRRRRLA